MRKFVWMIALYAPFVLAQSQKLDKDDIKSIQDTNKKALNLLLDDKNDDALTVVDVFVKELLTRFPEATLNTNKDYLDLLRTKGNILISAQSYDDAEPFYTKLCPLLKGANKTECGKVITLIQGLKGTTIEFVVDNPGKRTNILLGDNKLFCYLSDDPATLSDAKNCSYKAKPSDPPGKKIKEKAKPYTFRVEREGFLPEENIKVTILANKQNKYPETGALTLREKPALLPLSFSPQNATATVDGKPYAANTPFEPGEHIIALSAQGYVARQAKFTVREGAIYKPNSLQPEASISLQLNPYVTFSFEKPTEIELYEGSSRVRLTDNQLELESGSKRGPFIAKAKGFKDSDPISLPDQIVPGDVIKISLVQSGAYIVLKNQPPGATLSVDGKPFDLSKREFELTPNTTSYQLSVTSPGYLPAEKSVAISPNQELTIDASEMKPAKTPLRLIGFVAAGTGAVAAGSLGFVALQQRNKIEGTSTEAGLAQQACVLSNRPDLESLPDPIPTECTGNTNQKAFFDASRKRKTAALVSDIGLGAAVIGGGLVGMSFILKPTSILTTKTRDLALLVTTSDISVAFSF